MPPWPTTIPMVASCLRTGYSAWQSANSLGMKYFCPDNRKTYSCFIIFAELTFICIFLGANKSSYVKSRVWFSFKEGFNNAVKKDLTIADLL